ncbi:MGDG synthase family glycosyltransferase [Undibacterium sp. SXout7W]|uniref:MGDG synthase family glycosyltransferase n=1 Tax=Undibacterium sp. SXout7W TaxID=3413049 RepID=UPI003BEF7AD8
MRKKKILLLSVSAGAGHQRAAEAIRVRAVQNESHLDVLHLDVMNFVTTGFRKIYTDFYIRLVNKAPTLWGYLYHASNEAEADSTLQRLRRGIERLNARSLLTAIADFQPDAIICTHFLPAELLSRLLQKQRLACPVWVQVTDFDLHKMWVHDHMAGYFVANEETAYRVHLNGISKEKIHITGIPIMPEFMQLANRQQCAADLGIDPARTTILLMGGGAGLGQLDQVAEGLLNTQMDIQLIVLAGKNQQALTSLQQLEKRYPGQLVPLGFSNTVERLMACADLIITKPGGLTTAECLASGLPMLVNSPIPGQEERNADFLLEQGVALKAIDDISLRFHIEFLMTHPEKLADMRRKAQALGKPEAAASVLRQIQLST